MDTTTPGAARQGAQTRNVFFFHATLEGLLDQAVSGASLNLVALSDTRVTGSIQHRQLYTLAQIVFHFEHATEVHYCRINAGSYQRVADAPPDPPQLRAEELSEKMHAAVKLLAEGYSNIHTVVEAAVFPPEGEKFVAGSSRRLRYVKAERGGEVGDFTVDEEGAGK